MAALSHCKASSVSRQLRGIDYRHPFYHKEELTLFFTQNKIRKPDGVPSQPKLIILCCPLPVKSNYVERKYKVSLSSLRI